MIDGIGGIGYDLSAGGLAIDNNTRRPRLFKITAGSNPYTASEVVLLETDGSKSNTGIYDVTAAQKVLWEVNGNTSVPVNTIVEATPNAAGLGFYFKWQASGGAKPTLYASSTWNASHDTSSTQTLVANSSVALAAGKWMVFASGNARIQTTVVGDFFQCTLASVALGAVVPTWNTISYPCQVYNTGIQNLGTFYVAALFDSASSFTAGLYTQHFITGSITVSQVLTSGRVWAFEVL